MSDSYCRRDETVKFRGAAVRLESATVGDRCVSVSLFRLFKTLQTVADSLRNTPIVKKFKVNRLQLFVQPKASMIVSWASRNAANISSKF